MKHAKIKPSETTVDHHYQREMDTKRVEAMARNFVPHLLGVPVVSKRQDGTFVRVDGQHRLAAAIAAGRGDREILMEIHEGLSTQEEAELFLRLNGGRTAVGAIDKYKARLVAREPTALEIQTILKQLGCKIVRGQQQYGISAVDSIEFAYHKGNLGRVIRTLVTWLDGGYEAFNGKIVRAVSCFFAAFPDADPLHLAARMQKISAEQLCNRLEREGKLTIASKSEAARLIFTEVYNRNTPVNRRVVWGGNEAEKKVS